MRRGEGRAETKRVHKEIADIFNTKSELTSQQKLELIKECFDDTTKNERSDLSQLKSPRRGNDQDT